MYILLRTLLLKTTKNITAQKAKFIPYVTFCTQIVFLSIREELSGLIIWYITKGE